MDFQITKKEIGLLDANFEEMNRELDIQLATFQDYKVTEDNIPEAKQTRAKLNKIADIIDSHRKSIKAEYNAPLKAFEDKCKVLTGKIDECNSKIDAQIKAFDEQYKMDKLKRIKAYFDTLKAKVELSQIMDDKWLNKSVAEQKVFEEINEKIKSIQDALDTLADMELDPNALAILQAKYLTTLDLRKTISDYRREKELAEQCKKDLEEKQKYVSPVIEKEKEEVQTPQPQRYAIQFEVIGDYEQIMNVSRFLKQNGIEYKKVAERKI